MINYLFIFLMIAAVGFACWARAKFEESEESEEKKNENNKR